MVLFSVGVGLLVYALNRPKFIGSSNFDEAWLVQRSMDERAVLLGVASGLLTGGAVTAALYVIGFVLRLIRRPDIAAGQPPFFPPRPMAQETGAFRTGSAGGVGGAGAAMPAVPVAAAPGPAIPLPPIPPAGAGS
jgi:hypothetical protein